MSQLLRLAFRRRLLSVGRPFSTNTTADPLKPESLAPVLRSLNKELDLDAFLSRFTSYSASSALFRSTPCVYALAVSRLASAGRLADAASVIESRKSYSQEFGASEGFSAGLIALCGRAGLPIKAQETFLELQSLGLPRSTQSFNALLSALGSEPDKVVENFRLIPKENPEITPDVFSYSIVMKALCDKGDLDSALGLLELMKEKAVEPNVVTFNTLLNAFYANQRFEEAERIWAEMAENNCSPNARSYNAKLRWLASNGKTSDAVEVFGEMESHGVNPDGYSFTALIMGHCKDGNLEEAKKALDDLRKRGCAPNLLLFELLVPPLREAGEIDLAVNLCYESIKKKCYVPVKILQEVVNSLVESSNLNHARKLVKYGWKRYYSEDNLIMPEACLTETHKQHTKQEEGQLSSQYQLTKSDDYEIKLQEEKPSTGRFAKIGIIVKSFEKPKYLGAFGIPLDKNRIKLPTTRSLITVLRSPHIDKKSREQFEIKVRREYMVIKCAPNELHKKYFWFKRTRILGAQFELVFNYKTRLDMSRIQSSL